MLSPGFYSYLRLSIGSAMAALMDLKLKVNKATEKTINPDFIKIDRFMLVRYVKLSNHKLMMM